MGISPIDLQPIARRNTVIFGFNKVIYYIDLRIYTFN